MGLVTGPSFTLNCNIVLMLSIDTVNRFLCPVCPVRTSTASRHGKYYISGCPPIDHARSRDPISHGDEFHVAGPRIRTRESRAARRDLENSNRMWVVTGPFDGEVSNEVGFQSNALSSIT